ncbi:MAG: ABC transporter permease [Hyphomicrobiales bacterium]
MRIASVSRGWPGAVLGLSVAVFVVYPLLQLLLNALAIGAGGALLQPYREAFASPVALSALWGTVWLTAASVLFGVPCAVLLAWITSSTDAPLVKALAALPTLSLALSPLVGAVGWLVLLAPRVGILNLALRHVLGLHADIGPLNAYSIPVIVMLMSFYVVPYVYGPAYAAFTQIDSSLLEAARICGAEPRSAFLTIAVPILRPAILAGALIAAVMAASMFAIPLILASGTGLRVIPTQIYQYINQEGRPAPATAMASLLSAATILAMFLYLRALSHGRFVTVSGKGARRSRAKLGGWRWTATSAVLLFLTLSFIVPLASLIYLSLVGFWSGDVFSQKVSFDQYRRLVDFPSAMRALFNSTWLSALAATLALLCGLIVSYRRLRRPHAGNRLLAFLASLPLGVPSIVLGLAFLFAFTGAPLPLYGTAAILVLAYTVHVLPISARNSEAGLRQLAPELEEAGRVCGDTRGGVLRRILVPLLRQPLLAAWALTFIILFRDVSISVLLYTPSTIPSAVALLSIFDQGWITGAAAYSVIVTAISVVIVGLVIISQSPRAHET